MTDATDVVLYHANCADGFGAALSAWLALGDRARYIPVQYGQAPPPAAFEARRLYILDFSYPRDSLERIAGSIGADKLLVLDHHRTAESTLSGLPYATFDMGKSGAVLAWEHFHHGEDIPDLIQYVQDRDLWRWQLPESREFSAALSLEPKDFKRWKSLAEFADSNRHPVFYKAFIARGETVLAHQAMLVGSLADKASMRDVGGHTVPTVNSPLFQSEIGEELCGRFPDLPFAAIWFENTDGDQVWSLRSRNGFDVSEVAKAFGGGGHRAAAGFVRKANRKEGDS